LIEATVHRLHDRVKTGEQRRGREQIRQQVDAASPNPVLGQRALLLEIDHAASLAGRARQYNVAQQSAMRFRR